MLDTSSLQSIHIAYCFQSRLVAATTFCPDLKPHVELPIQSPSCSRIKPDILPFPNKLFQPDSLANHPQDLDEEWKFALYPNWCQHCFRKVSWITSKNRRSDSGRVLDVFSLLGDSHCSLYGCKDKRLSRVKCRSSLWGLRAGRLSTALPPKDRGLAACLTPWAPPQGPVHSPQPEDGQDHLRPTRTGGGGSCRKTGSRADGGCSRDWSHTDVSQHCRAEPPSIGNMVKPGEKLCQAAGWGHAAEVGKESQIKEGNSQLYKCSAAQKKAAPLAARLLQLSLTSSQTRRYSSRDHSPDVFPWTVIESS